MTSISLKSAVLAAAVVGLWPVGGAQAQWYSSYPQAPAGVSPDKPYAVEVAPNTYVFHRPAKRQASPRVEQPAEDRPRMHADRALIKELVKRHTKTKVIETTKTVREKPVVIEHERMVDDPPRVIERRHITEDTPGRGLVKQRREVATEDIVIEPGGSQKHQSAKGKRAARGADSKRVIKADAEVTILGPDRMSIRLFRKGHDANAEVE